MHLCKGPKCYLALECRDDANAIEFEINPPDADVTYEPYTEARRRAGVTPVSREHARDLIAQWWEAIAAGLSPPPTH